MSTTFKPGDVVQLKSGGPVMTVVGPSEGGELLCAWWSDKADEYKTRKIARALLNAAHDESATSGPGGFLIGPDGFSGEGQ